MKNKRELYQNNFNSENLIKGFKGKEITILARRGPL